ncbi:hypothetical protein C8R43DRAFT_1050679 [Mycena crocata]|nr:hypothetical protein C8R43DRAFT_1050679 [Mycena crocata]
MPLKDPRLVREADRTRIENISLQILELERSLSILRREKKRAEKRLASYTYPILTLPNEISSEIFLQCIPIYPICPDFIGPLSPTLLTRICRQWREIAFATPVLWRAMSINLMDHISDEENSTRLHLWMTRSRSLPVSICFERNDNAFPSQLCVEALNLHRARWEYLQLEGTSAEDACSLFSGPMPSLRELKLAWGIQPRSMVAFADAPLLRSLRFESFPWAVMLPWSQITSLDLAGVNVTDCTRVFKDTPALVHCTITLSDTVTSPRQPDIELRNLESLIFEEDSIVTGYIETLVVPALRVFQVPEVLLAEDSDSEDPLPTLASFISKSGCKLQELRITGEEFSSATKRSYRKAFPSIPKLTFHEYPESSSESDY